MLVFVLELTCDLKTIIKQDSVFSTLPPQFFFVLFFFFGKKLPTRYLTGYCCLFVCLFSLALYSIVLFLVSPLPVVWPTCATIGWIISPPRVLLYNKYQTFTPPPPPPPPLTTHPDNFYWLPINALMFSSCNDLQGMGFSTCSAWSPGQFDLTAFLSLVVYLKHAILC